MKSNTAVKDAGEIKREHMKILNIIFPNQLFDKSPLLKYEGDFLLIEEYLFFSQFKFHKQKLSFHRATMKYYESYLISKGKKVIYISSQEENHDIRELFKSEFIKTYIEINFIDPVDYWLNKRIFAGLNSLGVKYNKHTNPNFISDQDELKSFFKADKKKFFQTSFYKEQRKKHKILIDKHEEPIGGKWTFDSENRKKYPKGKSAPKIVFPSSDEIRLESMEYVESNFKSNYGDSCTEKISYAISHKEANQWLKQFIEVRFAEFGTYEDAIVSDEIFLNHSILTPMLNVGLICPKDIVNEAIAAFKKNNIPINSVEGFIRQIIGWREFMRGMYVTKGRQQRTSNFWGFTRKIPKSFYTGETGIVPIDDTIKKVIETGYCHHIERLMILGNFMVLCEFDPKEVYKWFMELFIDAYDWVMVPNVYGMSQFADGGLLSTKPYISGSNYIIKMSNYKKDKWCETWDGLFWSFMDKHRDFFLKNPRLGMLVRTYDKFNEEKKTLHKSNAENYLNAL